MNTLSIIFINVLEFRETWKKKIAFLQMGFRRKDITVKNTNFFKLKMRVNQGYRRTRLQTKC